MSQLMKAKGSSSGNGHAKVSRKSVAKGTDTHTKTPYVPPPTLSSPTKKRTMDVFNDIDIEVSPPKLRRQVASAWNGSVAAKQTGLQVTKTNSSPPSTGPFYYDEHFVSRNKGIVVSFEKDVSKKSDLIGDDDEVSLFADSPSTPPISRPVRKHKTTAKDKKVSYYNRSENDLYSIKNRPHFSRPFGSRRRTAGLYHRPSATIGPCSLAIPEFVPGMPSVRKFMTHELSTLSL